MKLNWNRQSVATFLRTEAVLSPAEDTEYVFSFPVRGARGCLRVSPRLGVVALSLSESTGDEPFATWHFDCATFEVNDETPEEGGPVLVATALTDHSGARCWFLISPADETFEVGTFFLGSTPSEWNVAELSLIDTPSSEDASVGRKPVTFAAEFFFNE